MATRTERPISGVGSQPPADPLVELHQVAKTNVNQLDQLRNKKRWLVLTIFEVIGMFTLLIWVGLQIYESQNKPQAKDTVQLLVNGFFMNPVLGNQKEILKSNPDQQLTQPSELKEGLLAVDLFTVPLNTLYFPIVGLNSSNCKEISEISYELISGPSLEPPIGTKIIDKQVLKPQATWIIQNKGDCQWEKLSLYSLYQGKQIDPILRRVDSINEVSLKQLSGEPGEPFTMTIFFEADQANQVSDEWVLVINDLQLFPKPHLLINVKKWVIVRSSQSSNSNNNGNDPTNLPTSGGTQHQRNTPTPPSRPTEPPPNR